MGVFGDYPRETQHNGALFARLPNDPHTTGHPFSTPGFPHDVIVRPRPDTTSPNHRLASRTTLREPQRAPVDPGSPLPPSSSSESFPA